MERETKQTLEENIPVEALCEVLDHYWRGELKSYRARPTDSHILHELARIANWLTGGSGWDSDDYSTAQGVMPELNWRAAGIVAKAPPPEATLPRPEGEADATWVPEGRTRCPVQGRKPSVQVVVGWDRPMSTFFAQVWDVPEGACHYKEGNLLLWLGTTFHEVGDIHTLAKAVEPFVTLPDAVASRLERSMVGV